MAVLSGCHNAGPPAMTATPVTAATAEQPQARVAAQPTPTAPLAPPTSRCTTADLRVAPARHEVKDGLDVERFTVTTTAAVGCTLTGTLNLVPKGPLSTRAPAATVDLAVSELPVPGSVGLAAGHGATVALPPGKSASFYLAWYSASSVVCVQSDGFGYNAPGDTTYTDLRSLTFLLGSLCDGIFYVSPVF
jgi:hypothetical protein